MDLIRRIALALVIIGAINWGLIGFFNFDLVAAIFGGQQSILSRIIYSLVGLSGLLALTILFSTRHISDTNQESNIRTANPNYGMEISKEFEDPNEINKDL